MLDLVADWPLNGAAALEFIFFIIFNFFYYHLVL